MEHGSKIFVEQLWFAISHFQINADQKSAPYLFWWNWMVKIL